MGLIFHTIFAFFVATAFFPLSILGLLSVPLWSFYNGILDIIILGLLCLTTVSTFYAVYTVYKTFKMSKMLMKYTNEIIIQYNGIMVVAFIAFFIQILGAHLFLYAIRYWGFLDIADERFYPALVFLVICYINLQCFFFNWSALIIKNILHSTVTGVFASHFFTAVPKEGSPKKFILPFNYPMIRSLICSFRVFDTICLKSLIMIPFRKFLNTGPTSWYDVYRYSDVSLGTISY